MRVRPGDGRNPREGVTLGWAKVRVADLDEPTWFASGYGLGYAYGRGNR